MTKTATDVLYDFLKHRVKFAEGEALKCYETALYAFEYAYNDDIETLKSYDLYISGREDIEQLAKSLDEYFNSKH